MTQADLPVIRQLAQNGAFSITSHAYDQMRDRGITYDDVESILTSATNQIIETQSPSRTPGKAHADERVLLYDPCGGKDAIVIFVALLVPAPDLRIVTVEHVDNAKWERKGGQVPCLVRK